MDTGIDWGRVAKADWIDKKARLLWIEREQPDASPYFNMMAECIKPTPEDYAGATEFVEKYGCPLPQTSVSLVGPYSSLFGGILSF